jgi:hypothetical protein
MDAYRVSEYSNIHQVIRHVYTGKQIVQLFLHVFHGGSRNMSHDYRNLDGFINGPKYSCLKCTLNFCQRTKVTGCLIDLFLLIRVCVIVYHITIIWLIWLISMYGVYPDHMAIFNVGGFSM